MPKFPLDLSKFKKIGGDEHHTVMQHPEGHTVKIAHKALSPKMREQLNKLSSSGAAMQNVPLQQSSQPMMADGGELDSATVRKNMFAGMKKAFSSEPSESTPQQPQQPSEPLPKNVNLGSDNQAPESNTSKALKSISNAFKAEGGLIKKPDPSNAAGGVRAAEGGMMMYADGTDNAGGASDAATMPINVNQMSDVPRQPSAEDMQVLKQLGDNQQPQQPAASQPDFKPGKDSLADDIKKVSQAADQEQQSNQQVASPDAAAQSPGSDFDKVGEAAEKAAYAKSTYELQQAANQQKLANDYQSQLKDLADEHDSLMDDIRTQKLDFNRYLGNKDTLGKIGTIASVALGGLGTINGGRNVALDMLNRSIDNDVAQQQADLGRKENLLSANTRQYGNVKDALDATRLAMQGAALMKVQGLEAQAVAPMAKMQAQAMATQLQQQINMGMQQLAFRKMLGSTTGDVSKMDPASYVPYLVPADRQKDVLHEIGQAQNAAKNGDAMLKSFDQATKENSALGRLERGGFTPPSILAMRSLALPMIHDAEGRVNEFEQKTISDLEPKPFDRDSTIAAKKQALINFLQQKAAAPNAKAFGIDLNRFQSTGGPETRLSPQQQSMVQWARSNPNNPNAALVLKKLGLQ